MIATTAAPKQIRIQGIAPSLLRLGEIAVDLFAGGGGASRGIELAIGISPAIAINHDPHAIAMHAANHPDTEHLCESVFEVDPRAACRGRRATGPAREGDGAMTKHRSHRMHGNSLTAFASSDFNPRDLGRMDYRATAGLYEAREAGSPQRRRRVFILAHANHRGFAQHAKRHLRQIERGGQPSQRDDALRRGAALADAASFGRIARQLGRPSGRREGRPLCEVIHGPQDQRSPSTPGNRHAQLNPDWVEGLMGLPRGWTAFACSETAWLSSRPNSHSETSGDSSSPARASA